MSFTFISLSHYYFEIQKHFLGPSSLTSTPVTLKEAIHIDNGYIIHGHDPNIEVAIL